MDASSTKRAGTRCVGSHEFGRDTARAYQRIVCLLALLSSLVSPLLATEPTTTQTIPLTAGWNLISIQVGNSPIPIATFAANISPVYYPNDSSHTPHDPLKEVWGYTPSGSPSIPGGWKTYQPLEPAFPSDLTVIEQGKAYWVNVSQSTTLLLANMVAWNGTASIAKGWNLLGFAGVSFDVNEVQELSAVFGSQFDRIQQVWTFDTSTQSFKGYDLTAIPALKDLTSVSPGKGYWVYSISDTTISLTPQPYLALPADGDASPPQPAELFSAVDPRYLGTSPTTYAGKQVRYRAAADVPYDLNANGILDEPATQDTILYETASEAIPITIGNSGSGLLTWTLENNVSWIYTAPADSRTWPTGVTSRPKLASGTVSSEKDTLILYADRTGMTPGRKSGDTVTLWIGGVAKVIKLLIDVPEIDGDWKGFATTSRVGGKDITLGEVRLALNAFRPDGATGGSFRAVLNREQAILFPRDVYMDGIFYSGNQFKLTTNFEMPAGDRNAPPYNTFQHTTTSNFPGDPDAAKKAARGDKDWNGDGKVDVMNPFPFGIRREITLIGTRTTPNRLEGSYIEAIRGMLPPVASNPLPSDINQFLGNSFLTTSQPVFIEGTFVLERQTFTPSQRSIVNTTVEPGITFGGSTSGSHTSTVNVNTTASINGTITVTLNIDMGQVDPALLRITLVSPSGSFYTLHDYAAVLAGTYTLPAGTFSGEPANGDWQLVIEWDNTSGERATLTSWGLKIEAASTHGATGRLVQQGTSTPIPNVSVNLEGGVTTVSTTTAADGTFSFPQLTENDYTLVINAPGYQNTTATFFISEQDVALGDVQLTPLNVTSPEIRAAPALGYEPLNVDFQMLVPVNYGATNVTWDYGDGSRTVSGTFTSLVAPSHVYQSAGDFTPIATLSGGSLSSPVTVTFTNGVHVQRTRTTTVYQITLVTPSTDRLAIGAGRPANGTMVRLSSTGTLPNPLLPGVDYYATQSATFSVVLSQTLGGPQIDITDIGSGVHTISWFPAGAPTQQVIAGIQMGSVAARMDVGGNVPTANAFSYLNGEPQTAFEPTPGGTPVAMKSVIDYTTGKPVASYAVSATGPSAASATIYQESQWDSATFDLDRFPFGTSNWAISSALEDSDYGRSGDIMASISPTAKGQVFLFYNTSATDNGTTATDEKWDARAWSTTRQTSNPPLTLPALPATDLYQSDGTFAAYTPATPSRPDRLRMAVTLGGAILSTEISPSPMGDVFLFPGRTLK